MKLKESLILCGVIAVITAGSPAVSASADENANITKYDAKSQTSAISINKTEKTTCFEDFASEKGSVKDISENKENNNAVESGEWDGEFLSEYFPLGLSADIENEWYVFDNMPVAGFVDGGKVMADGNAAENGGIYLKVIRKNGVPEKLKTIDSEEFSNLISHSSD